MGTRERYGSNLVDDSLPFRISLVFYVTRVNGNRLEVGWIKASTRVSQVRFSISHLEYLSTYQDLVNEDTITKLREK